MKQMKATLRRLWRLTGATTSLVSLAVMVAVCLIIGAGGAGKMAAAASCDTVPTGVATEDYFLNFKEPHGLMPDDQFAEIAAQLHVHRVSPVYANGKCSGVATQAAVLIHGRTTPGPVVFDLQGKDSRGNALSVQEGLARAGIDTFAPSLVGYGKSTRFSLNDPGNASLSNCQTASPPCDLTDNPGINPLNQQEQLLKPNPLAATRAHSSNFRFGRIDMWVRDIDQVINSALSRAKPTDGKVALVGYSAGGVRVGRTLYAGNPLGGKLLENRDKMIGRVSRVVFVSSLFGGSTIPNTGQPFIPTEDPETGLPTFPLTLETRSGSDGIWDLPRDATGSTIPECDSGRIIPGTQQQVWNQTMANDPLVGSQWGPNVGQPNGGLNRAPTFSTYGWNPEVAGQLSKPTLVIQGRQDGALSRTPTGLDSGQNIYNALPASMTNKVLVEVQCASHALPWEGSDSNSWAGPHSLFKNALIEWIKSGTFNGAANGKFTVDENGGVSGG